MPKNTKELKALKPRPAAEPAGWTEAEAYAVKACISGTATEHQQRLAMQWIINAASVAHGQHYHDNDRDTAFALGRAFVGQQILGIARIDLVSLTQPMTKEK